MTLLGAVYLVQKSLQVVRVCPEIRFKATLLPNSTMTTAKALIPIPIDKRFVRRSQKIVNHQGNPSQSDFEIILPPEFDIKKRFLVFFDFRS